MNTLLENKVIVLTRSKEQASGSLEKLESLGAHVILLPAIKIKPIKVFNMFDNYAAELNSYDYIIFTSQNAVSYTLERLKNINKTIDRGIKIIAIGERTASKCKEYEINVDIVPDDFSAGGLIEHFADKNIKGKKFFIPSSALARKELKEGLIKQGATVVQTPIYDIGLPDKQETEKSKEKIEGESPDLFIFTSPSTFKNTLKILEIDNPTDYFKNASIAALGRTTAEAIKDTGVKVDVIPEEFTMDNLISEIINFYSNRSNIDN